MSNAPPPSGIRTSWHAAPPTVPLAIERWLGEAVHEAQTQTAGFSPGLAARIVTASGRRVFVKAVGPTPNALASQLHRREAEVMASMPSNAPVPALLWSHDDPHSGWVVLAFQDIEGWLPAVPWRDQDLARVVVLMEELASCLSPAPVTLIDSAPLTHWGVFRQPWWIMLNDDPPPALDDWSQRHARVAATIQAGAAQATAGSTLVHLDVRGDNILLTPTRAYMVDWPHARTRAAWVDVVLLAPSVAMQGGRCHKHFSNGSRRCNRRHPMP